MNIAFNARMDRIDDNYYLAVTELYPIVKNTFADWEKVLEIYVLDNTSIFDRDSNTLLTREEFEQNTVGMEILPLQLLNKE